MQGQDLQFMRSTILLHLGIPHRPQPGMPDSDSGSGSDEGMPSPRSWDSVELVDVAPTPTLFSISDGELSALGSGEEEEEEEESHGGPDSSTEMIFDSISIQVK